MPPSSKKTLSQEPFYLVSASPRRRELLQKLGIDSVVLPVDCHEYHDPSLTPEELTLSLARQKMEVFTEGIPYDEGPGLTTVYSALTADTIVHIEGFHLGKPHTRKEAEDMLRLLSGKVHRVSTAFVLLLGGEYHEKVRSTDVAFHKLKASDIEFYLKTQEWIDAAGAYKIQETGEIMINWINGSWSNVMGLPISSIYAILRDNNFWGPLL